MNKTVQELVKFAEEIYGEIKVTGTTKEENVGTILWFNDETNSTQCITQVDMLQNKENFRHSTEMFRIRNLLTKQTILGDM